MDLDAVKKLVERNKQYSDTPKQNELKKQLEIPYDFRSPQAADHIRNIYDELSRVTLQENIKKNDNEYNALDMANRNIIRRLGEIEVSLVPQKQSMFSWRKNTSNKDNLITEKKDLERLQKDIQQQLPYYQTGGKTRKRRTKRIKRTRVR
jgi:hypothetical protein